MTLRNKIINLFEAHDLFDTQGSPRPADNGLNMWHSYPSVDYAMIEEDKIKPRIFCDMDGVICDFLKAFEEKTGIAPEVYEATYGKDAFWDIVESWGEELWETLDWMPDGQELWSYIQPHNPIILSACEVGYQIRGKTVWLRNNVGYTDTPITNPSNWKGQSKITYHPDKWKFILNPGDILIDDTPKKINGWVAAGGNGILHKSASQTISKLKEIGL